MAKKIQIGNIIYEAKTDFRTAIECNKIATDDSIGDFERALGIIYMVFGSNGLDNPEHYEKLIKWIKNWISCGKDIKESNENPDMDYVEDMDYIEASFMSDYNIDLENSDMEWHKFNNLINGLSNSEMGNCCILNRIRNLRNYDLSQIKDNKERERLAKAKEMVALKSDKRNEVKLTKEQEESMRKLDEIIGFKK